VRKADCRDCLPERDVNGKIGKRAHRSGSGGDYEEGQELQKYQKAMHMLFLTL
jgi:hypothetical protein